MNNKVKKILIIVFILGLIGSTAWMSQTRGVTAPYKNVIVMVPDGCSQSIQTLARWYNGDPLSLDDMVSGTVSTYMANSIITGSAAAGTAFATGHKTTVRFLGVGPREDDLLTGFVPSAAPYVPVASVLEAAKLNNKSVGLVATSRITHATPAAYACHIHDRGMDNEIMENMVYEDIDVVFGGGYRHLINSTDSYTTTFGATWNGRRTDGQNLTQVLIGRGCQIVDNKDDMNSLTSGPVWGLFDDSHLDSEMDRELLHDKQPSLSEMTAKAIDLLDDDTDGFFLMVEGSQIDWAGHANDPAYMVTDFIEFDEAVKVAKDFAFTDGNTLVLVFPDHNTGGMKIGNYYQDSNEVGEPYTATTLEGLIDPLKGMKVSSGVLAGMLETNMNNKEIKEIFEEWWGITITNQDIAAMGLHQEIDSYTISRYISEKYTVIGWTTHGHNGEDVPLWSYPSDPVLGFSGVSGHYDNTELAYLVAEALGFDLSLTTDELFIELTNQYIWSIEDPDGDNPEIVIQTPLYNEARINAGSDVISIDGGTYYLKGIVVYAPITGQVWMPQDAYNFLNLN